MKLNKKTSYYVLAFGGSTPKKALLTSLFVGTILTLINHGDTILIDKKNPNYFKIILTYFVPYCVTTWGLILGKLENINLKNKNE